MIRVIILAAPMTNRACHSPALPTTVDSRRNIITPRIVNRLGVKTAPKVPNRPTGASSTCVVLSAISITPVRNGSFAVVVVRTLAARRDRSPCRAFVFCISNRRLSTHPRTAPRTQRTDSASVGDYVVFLYVGAEFGEPAGKWCSRRRLTPGAGSLILMPGRLSSEDISPDRRRGIPGGHPGNQNKPGGKRSATREGQGP